MDKDRPDGELNLPDLAEAIYRGRLSEALREWMRAGGGGVYLLDFRPLRESIGENWDLLNEKIHSRIEHTIEETVTEEHKSGRIDDFSYLVGFDRLSEANGEFKCAQICRRISKTLLGQDATSELVRIFTFVVAENGELGIIESKIEKTNGIDFVFLPLVFAGNNAVSTFLCMPVKKTTGGGFNSGYGVISEDDDGDGKSGLDLVALRQLTHRLDDLARERMTSQIVCPVNFETVIDSIGKAEFFQHWNHFVAAHAERVIVEIVDPQDWLPFHPFAEVVSMLGLHAQQIFVRVPIWRPQFATYRAAGVEAVGMDLHRNNQADDVVMDRMNRFVEKAIAHSLKTYVHGIRSISLYAAAVCAGFDYIGGYPVGDVLGNPGKPHLFDNRRPFIPLFDAA